MCLVDAVMPCRMVVKVFSVNIIKIIVLYIILNIMCIKYTISVCNSTDCTEVINNLCSNECPFNNNSNKKQLRLALILPADSDNFVPALSRVRPFVDSALQVAHEKGLISKDIWDVSVIEGDTRCNLEHGLITAVDVNGRCCPHAYIGPTCELALSSVARLVKLWKTPLVTAGALASDYTVDRTDPEDEYFMLVRVGWSFRDMAATLVAFMDEYEWKRIMLIYDTMGYADVSGFQTCYLMMTSLVTLLKEKNFDYSAYETDKNKQQSFQENLKNEVGYKYGSVFLGPVCDYVIAPVARFAGVWGVPVVTAGGQADAFHHKATGQYPTLTRLMGSYSAIGEALKSILKQFGWSVAGLLYHNHGVGSARGHSLCHFALAAVFTALNSTPAHRSFDQETASHLDYLDLLRAVAQSARIVVVCANQTTVREILLAADDLNMVGSGEYVFFNIELYTSGNAAKQPWNVTGDSPERNEKARRAYEALLTVTARTPNNPEYEQFSNEVRQLAADRYNYSYGAEEPVSTFVTAFHDAVLLYAHALNETIANNGSERDGEDITRRMWNRTFGGIAGDVTIDGNGDRVADYSLLDLDPETNSFQVVAHYVGQTRSLEFEEGKKIHWAGGRTEAPPDTPTCGYDGALCPDNSLPGYAILSIVLSSVVVLLSIVSFFIYRHFKVEAAIASMTWRIHWCDVLIVSPASGKGRGSVHSLAKSEMTFFSEDAISLGDINRQVFVPTAIYKGSKVAVKSLHRSRIELTRPLLLELKKMKDLHHAHLVRFIGACVEPPHCALLTEYCPRGSLQDILEHEQIQLDWVFRYSLMHDAVKGMCYLHDSDIRTHGNLKSSNCVVDSRFVLKIADFGLFSLRGPSPSNEPPNTDAYAFWRKQLWTAPELLRMHPGPPPEGSQKGDVYSFGIIMHEIVTRQGPFHLPEKAEYGPRELVEAVKAGHKPPLRPTLSGLACEPQVAQLMSKCWAEEPAERPDFPALKTAIRRLNSGYESSNILDNLLTRMEQYANNLEALVEERTADYLEEKRKCEELLYQLLPKSVASQLILGQSVNAETYDNVTIYFSDIVGFTSLSAQSTPLQVVDLLNDLYTCFDSIIENFDVYKVETIGDAYMVVSGLPVRNGTLHAREVARMALALLNAVLSFRIRHRPGEQLKLRIGLHSGPCVAGVVGHKMPRYCLFGDTVNTASRMESNGLPLKIHVSSATKSVLDSFKSFHLECRGEVEMKGKGKLITYWLLGEDNVGQPIIKPFIQNFTHAIPVTASPPLTPTLTSPPTPNVAIPISAPSISISSPTPSLTAPTIRDEEPSDSTPLLESGVVTANGKPVNTSSPSHVAALDSRV